jgi:hypothetical protein
MEIPRFRFDYSFIDIEELRHQCITPDEVESVFYSPNSFYADWHRTDNLGYVIGYSMKSKFISFTFEIVDSGNVIKLIDIFLSNEIEIRTRYFGI